MTVHGTGGGPQSEEQITVSVTDHGVGYTTAPLIQMPEDESEVTLLFSAVRPRMVRANVRVGMPEAPALPSKKKLGALKPVDKLSKVFSSFDQKAQSEEAEGGGGLAAQSGSLERSDAAVDADQLTVTVWARDH